jgi:hypothetical protein
MGKYVCAFAHLFKVLIVPIIEVVDFQLIRYKKTEKS